MLNTTTHNRSQHHRNQHQPGRPTWPRAFEDLRREHGFERLRVEGTLPDDLDGVLYWNGPGRFSAFGDRTGMWLDGDGAIGAVRIAAGHADGAVRMVRTPSYEAEQQSGKRLYSRFDMPSPRPVREYWLGDSRNQGNTSVWAHRDRVFALCPSGVPIEVSADDLRTVGPEDFAKLIGPGFSAHASYCASRRAFYNFRFRPGRTSQLELLVFPNRGNPAKLVSIPLDRASFVHDFMVTDRYAIFVIPPLFFDALPMLFNLRTFANSFRHQADLGSEVIVVPLDAPHRPIRIPTDAMTIFHFANAFERGDEIIIDAPLTRNGMHAWRWFGGLVEGRSDVMPDNTLHRLRIDVARRHVAVEPMGGEVGEQPRISPCYENRAARYVYMVSFTRGHRGHVNALQKLDLDSGRALIIDFGDEQYPSEPVFVPRRHARGEDDGYLLSLVYDGLTHSSYLAVLDAASPQQPPLAELAFEQHIVPHFHGTWVDRRWSGAHVTA